MTERQVQDGIYRDLLGAHEFICPGYTPINWYECDVFALTRAGCFVEHEVKLTRADFRKDATKGTDRAKFISDPGGGQLYERRSKHERLAARDKNGPVRFWYVVPDGLIDPSEVPEWAGLKYARMDKRGVRVYAVKNAPTLHRDKCPWSDRIRDHVQGIFFYRFWTLRLNTSVHKPEHSCPDAEVTERQLKDALDIVSTLRMERDEALALVMRYRDQIGEATGISVSRDLESLITERVRRRKGGA